VEEETLVIPPKTEIYIEKAKFGYGGLGKNGGYGCSVKREGIRIGLERDRDVVITY